MAMILKLVTFVLIVSTSFYSYAAEKYTIYLDADFTGTVTSSHAIKQGILTALHEVNNQVQGVKLELILKDHKANSRRSKKNFQQFLDDKDALLIFTGLHSPPLLANRDFINSNKLLTLVPWAAAGPITRTPEGENWIFRLSVDDSTAGAFIAEQASKQGFKKPFLLLEDTGWGRSNERTMTNALMSLSLKPLGLEWFNWGIGINQAKLILRNIKESGADVIFFVGNAPEGASFINAMIQLPAQARLPIRSHWGITGGNFTEQVPHELRKIADIQVIQTNYPSLTNPNNELTAQVAKMAVDRNSELQNIGQIKAITGFVHGYDLTKLVLAAMEQITLTGNKNSDKELIREALEALKEPVRGLLKEYKEPFSAYGRSNIDGHEALRVSDYSMGEFNSTDNITLIENL